MAPKKQKIVKTVGKLKVKAPKGPNAVGLVCAIKYEKVGDKYLFKTEEVTKNEELFQIIGTEDPTTTQLNMNYLLSTAISDLEKRMSALEKKIRLHFAEKKDAVKKAKAVGVKRKLEEAFDMDAEESQPPSFPTEPGSDASHEESSQQETEEGEIVSSQ